MTSIITHSQEPTVPLRNAGLEYRDAVHAERLKGSAEARRAQADAAAALAPALATMGRRLTPAQVMARQKKAGAVRPATRIAD